MSMPKGQSCKKCRFWIQHPDNADGDRAHCKRTAPQVRGLLADRSYHLGGVWPVTTSTDWCGEYEPEPKKT